MLNCKTPFKARVGVRAHLTLLAALFYCCFSLFYLDYWSFKHFYHVCLLSVLFAQCVDNMDVLFIYCKPNNNLNLIP